MKTIDVVAIDEFGKPVSGNIDRQWALNFIQISDPTLRRYCAILRDCCSNQEFDHRKRNKAFTPKQINALISVKAMFRSQMQEEDVRRYLKAKGIPTIKGVEYLPCE